MPTAEPTPLSASTCSASTCVPADLCIRIEPCNGAHLAHVVHLADEAFGKGYLDAHLFQPDHCLVALSQQQVVGFIYAQCNDCQAVLQTVVVHPAFRSQGIALLLGKEALRRFPARVSWTSPAWECAGKVPADKLLRALGFEPILRVANYWHMDSLRRGYACPVCGNPCHCSSVIYGRPTF